MQWKVIDDVVRALLRVTVELVTLKIGRIDFIMVST